MRSKILILFLFSNFLLSQTPRNLGFENVTVENMVLTWKTINRDYKIEIDSLEKFSDKRSLKIEGKNNLSDDKSDFALVSQRISKKNFVGKELTLKTRIKSKSDFDGVAFPYIKTIFLGCKAEKGLIDTMMAIGEEIGKEVILLKMNSQKFILERSWTDHYKYMNEMKQLNNPFN